MNKEIIEYIRNYQNFLAHNQEIFDVLEGELLPRIKIALREQLLSDRAFNVASKLIPPINIVKRLVDKLTVIYSEAPTRTATNPTDQMLLDYYADMANTSFGEANRFFNSMKAAAIEPFIDKGEPNIRVISGHQCLARSTNKFNPLEMDEFIKFIDKNTIFVYSDENFQALDTDGNQSKEHESSDNPLGIIPQTYIRRSRHLLVPKADSDLLQMGVLIPTMIANLNFAAHMQSHSIVYGIDIDAENLEINPDALWLLSTSASGVKPELGILKPQVDITEVWQSIASQLQIWFESRNIRPGEGDGTQNSLSGIALMIKEMDASSDIKDQKKYFMEAEQDFWNKLKIQHNFWVENMMIEGMPKFSEDFAPSITFADLKPYEDETVIIDREIKKVNELLTSRQRARRVVNKNLDENELEKLEQEIAEESRAQESNFNNEVEDAEESSFENNQNI